MKRIALSILATFLFFALIYLIGCFTENSFNITYWREGARTCIGLFGGIISIIIGGLTFEYLKS